MRPATLKSASALGGDKPHGTRMRYMAGCRCRFCRAANSNYQCRRAALIKQGLDNGIVSAEAAREHILELSALGIGRRSVAQSSGVPLSIVFAIKQGTRKNIRKNTERKILAVSIKDAKGGVLLDARPVWKMIRSLLKDGYSRKDLARRLGYRNWLQFGKLRMTARNVLKVVRFHRISNAE